MNTMDALRLSVIDDGLKDGQKYAVRLEAALEAMIASRNISEFSAPVAYLRSAAMSYRAVAEHIERIASQIESTERN